MRPFLSAELAPTRSLGTSTSALATHLGAIFSVFYLYSAVAGSWVPLGVARVQLPSVPFHVFLPMFIFFTGVLIFLYYPASRRSPATRASWPDWLAIGLVAVFTVDFIWNFEERGELAGLELQGEVVFGFIATVISLELCRRVLGPILPVVALGFLAYNLFGPYFPAGLSHKGFSFGTLMSYLYSDEGIYGVITNVYATFVFLFVLFGAFLKRTGVGDLFVDLAFALVGRTVGGAAKASVISSGLVGTVVGSGAANIVITGNFSIPLMKRAGYRPGFAAAVEAVASIGGHLMPPVMGAAAFILAAFTNTPYTTVILVSIVPALLYYSSLLLAVHFEARRHGLAALPTDGLPSFWRTLRRGWLLLFPIAVLVVLLLMRYSPYYAAFWATVASIAAAAVRKETRLSARDVWETLAEGARASLVIGATAGVMGLVLAAVTLPGLALKFSSLILAYSQGYLPLALLLVAVVSYVLGMGMTITAAYILLSILAGPALVEMGVPLLTAHLVIFWFSQDSALTPPFALGAIIAAGIAGSDPMRTGFTCLRLAKPLYVIPVLMVYTPLLMNGGWGEIIWTWTAITVGFIGSTAALEGYLLQRVTVAERIGLASAAVLLFWPSWPANLLGLGLLGSIAARQQWQRSRAEPRPALTA